MGVLLTTIPGLACAAGLGEFSLLSYLGQPFRAQIELVAQDSEFSGFISPRIASPDAFRTAGLRYGPSVPGLQVTLRRPVVGAPFLEITSARPVNEPAFDLLIETDWDSTTLRRAYPVLLEVPGFGPAGTVPAGPAVRDEARDSVVSIAAGPAQADPGAGRVADARPQEAAPSARREPAPVAKAAAVALPLSPDTLARVRALEEKAVLHQQQLDGLDARATVMEKAIRDMEPGLEACRKCAAPAKEEPGARPPVQGSMSPKPEMTAKPEASPAPPPDQKQEVGQVASANRKPAKPPTALPLPAPATGATDLLDDETMYAAAGGGVVLLGGLAYWLVRRRRVPVLTAQTGRGGDPNREETQLKLLRVFAERGDVAAYRRVAGEFRQASGTGSRNWPTVAAMGRMLDPGNPLYEDSSAPANEGPAKAG